MIDFICAADCTHSEHTSAANDIFMGRTDKSKQTAPDSPRAWQMKWKSGMSVLWGMLSADLSLLGAVVGCFVVAILCKSFILKSVVKNKMWCGEIS